MSLLWLPYRLSMRIFLFFISRLSLLTLLSFFPCWSQQPLPYPIPQDTLLTQEKDTLSLVQSNKEADKVFLREQDTLVNSFADSLTLASKPSSARLCGTPLRRHPYVNPWSLVIPMALIGRGIFSIDSRFDHKLQHYVTNNIKGKLRIDDHLQYLPIASVFAFPNLGMRPYHNLKARLLVGSTAYALTAIFVNSLKYSVRQLRPDRSTHNSFPSGHTATVFTGVEILYQEYKHYDPWIGISGYIVATSVGLLRIYNNRHWASDVVAGAGIGILSAKIAYLLLPYTSKIIKREKQSEKDLPQWQSLLLPTYDYKEKSVGLSLTIHF